MVLKKRSKKSVQKKKHSKRSKRSTSSTSGSDSEYSTISEESTVCLEESEETVSAQIVAVSTPEYQVVSPGRDLAPLPSPPPSPFDFLQNSVGEFVGAEARLALRLDIQNMDYYKEVCIL